MNRWRVTARCRLRRPGGTGRPETVTAIGHARSRHGRLGRLLSVWGAPLSTEPQPSALEDAPCCTSWRKDRREVRPRVGGIYGWSPATGLGYFYGLPHRVAAWLAVHQDAVRARELRPSSARMFTSTATSRSRDVSKLGAGTGAAATGSDAMYRGYAKAWSGPRWLPPSARASSYAAGPRGRTVSSSRQTSYSAMCGPNVERGVSMSRHREGENWGRVLMANGAFQSGRTTQPQYRHMPLFLVM